MTVVFYCSQFYALFFLTQVLKVDTQAANWLIASALFLGAPFFVVVGRLSDHVGRKKLVLLGCACAACTYFPIFRGLTHYANPGIEAAARTSPVTIVADKSSCSFQFDLLGKSRFLRSCDIAKSALSKAGVPYTVESAPRGTPAAIRIGRLTASGVTVYAFEGDRLTDAQLKDASTGFSRSLSGALTKAGYPSKADPARINYPMLLLLLWVLVLYVTLAYGPLGAWLVELFPPRIRYTAMSVPYHLGVGWIGGFLPTVAFAIVAITGDIYSGLWYPVLIALFSAVVGALCLPETLQRRS
jgi:MFS family permease